MDGRRETSNVNGELSMVNFVVVLIQGWLINY